MENQTIKRPEMASEALDLIEKGEEIDFLTTKNL